METYPREAYLLKPHEPDVLRQLRGLTDEEYAQVRVIIATFKRPLGPPCERA